MSNCTVRDLGIVPYLESWQAMLDFTDQRNSDTPDELWILEHPPVYTQGKAGKAEHILQSSEIPLVQSDRGGQVTYHGPGQIICYTLIDLVRNNIGVKRLVSIIEQSIIETLAYYSITAQLIAGSPGVYIKQAKIASLGLRVRKGKSLHGLSLNVDMDLLPFKNIRPCGLDNISVTQMSAHNATVQVEEVKQRLVLILTDKLQYPHV